MLTTIFGILRQLNNTTPFTWEIRTTGEKFTLLCEEDEVHISDEDIYLTDMSAETCLDWMGKIVHMTI